MEDVEALYAELSTDYAAYVARLAGGQPGTVPGKGKPGRRGR
jgi:hypothetical protein